MEITLCWVLLFGVVAVHANVCCFPKQYEAIQGITKATVKNGRLSILYGRLHYYFDAISRRETFIEELNDDGIDMHVTVIKDYNVTNTKYVISGNHCTKTSLTPFKEGCIPDWAKKLVTSFYGVKSTGMNFDVYNNSAGGVTSFLISSAVPDQGVPSSSQPAPECFPIFDVSYQPTGAGPYMQAVMFHNFTLGITDSRVFDIPAVCNPGSMVGK